MEEKIKISMICCWTREDMVADMQKSTNSFQHYEIEWVLIDNRESAYTSAAAALNAGFLRSTTNYLIFLHQDIVFHSEEDLERIINEIKNNRIVGVAGRKENGGPLVTSIVDGVHHERTHHYPFHGEAEKVFTLDECLIGMNRQIFSELHGFDEDYFDGWHFYGVDLCIRANLNHIECVVVPSKLWHRPKGTHDQKWELYEKKLRKRYKNRYGVLYYPCGRCYANPILFYATKWLRPLRKQMLSGK
ncbi:MAG: glycosyltransferase [Clostridia bacterium]|nr:glycosyltransferase [Clostridia bacterium]